MAGIWIVVSDFLLGWLVENETLLIRLQILKGWFFVFVTGLLLFWLIRKQFAALRASNQALRQSEAHFRSVVETARDGIVSIDETGRIIFWNQGARLMFGYSQEEIIGQPLARILPKYSDQAQKMREDTRQLINQTVELTALKKDGAEFPIELSLVRWQAGPEALHTGIIRDITQRKEAEREMRSRNRELMLLNQVIAASASSIEPETMLEAACRELARGFDLPQAAAALLNEDKTVMRIVAEHRPEDKPSILNEAVSTADKPIVQHLMRRKTPLVIDDVRNDPRTAPMRELLKQHQTISMMVIPLLIEEDLVGALALGSGQSYQFSAQEIDLAWRVADQIGTVLARTRLMQMQQRLITAVEQTGEGMVVTDLKGDILYVNPAFENITGYSRAEVIGQNSRFLQSGHHSPEFYRELWQTIVNGGVWEGRFTNKRKDGVLYTEDATISPVRDRNGVLIGYVGVKRDITAELQLEEQYHQAQKMESIGRLASGVAHDFNNILTGIMGYADLSLQALAADDPIRNDIEGIQKNVERAATLTRQLLTFARRQVIEPRVLDLNSLILNIDKMLRRLIGEDIELVTLTDPDLYRIKADPGQMEQVLMNLAVNARDAMPEGGKLIIETANVSLEADQVNAYAGLLPGEYVWLQVSDNGIGISSEVQKRIFEPFFTTKGEDKGTGLGLATVFGIIKQNGGHIQVESEPQQGTSFRIYLPPSKMEEGDTDRQSRKDFLPGGTETILLVEDEPAVRNLAARVLRERGYTVLEAVNGEEALRLAQEYDKVIDLLLTDIIMPQMSGKTLAERLANLRPATRIIFTSGYVDDTMLPGNALEDGIVFIQKPFSPTTLAYQVRRVLD